MAATTFDVPAAGGSYAQRARWGISPRFDFETGDIVLDGAGRVDMTDAANSWLQWCVKAVYTQRGACRAYTDSFGADMEWAMSQTGRDARGEAIINAITDALKADPYGRTLAVSGFEFDWSADGVNVSFELTGAGGCQSSLSVGLDDSGV